MCLYIKENRPKRVWKRITCYKVLVNSENGWSTPFINRPVDDDIVSGRKLFVPETPGCPEEKDYGWWSVHEGFIHTYASLADASTFAEYGFNEHSPLKSYCVFKCVIPIGTRYYKGSVFCNVPGYASEKIRFKKIVYPNTKQK